MKDYMDPRPAKALARYEVISAFLALAPRRGQRRKLLEELASRTWRWPDGEPYMISAETIRSWIRRYRRGGLPALEDRPRPKRGCSALSAQVIERACVLKKEVPERSLDRLIVLLEVCGEAEPGTVSRSTLHRELQKRGLSKRALRTPDTADLDRFEADTPNDLWQSDMLTGPWLPDPERPGKVRRAYLYAYLDDHSRLLLWGRFSFKGDLPALELVFRRSVQRWGVPKRTYYDNGMVYRSGHMRQILALLGVHRLVFTQTYRPMGHGKIEALNRLIRAVFLAELKASGITTLDALNEAFLAWAHEYNRDVHSETGQTPLDRWRAGVEQTRWADEQSVRQAFLWREKRTPDKTGVFSLFGTRYQVGAELARRRIQVRYDPEAMDTVEVWHDDKFVERTRPLDVQAHRRARAPKPPPQQNADTTRGFDWLGHLVQKRREQGFVEPTPRQLADQAVAHRTRADDDVVRLLAERLEPAVFDETEIREHLERFGPYQAERSTTALDTLIQSTGNDRHVTVYLDAIREASHQEDH